MTLQDERDQHAAEQACDERERALLYAFVRAEPVAGLTTSRIPFAVVAGVAMSGLFAATGTVVAVPADAAEIRYAGGWTSTQHVITAERARWLAPAAADTRTTATLAPPPAAVATEVTGRDVTQLHKLSGLTYKQIAKTFGVSERTVHAWAAGTSTPSRRHLERLTTVLEAVQKLPGPDASSRRAQLLTEGYGQPGIYNRWLRELAAGRAAVGDVDTLHEPAKA